MFGNFSKLSLRVASIRHQIQPPNGNHMVQRIKTVQDESWSKTMGRRTKEKRAQPEMTDRMTKKKKKKKTLTMSNLY